MHAACQAITACCWVTFQTSLSPCTTYSVTYSQGCQNCEREIIKKGTCVVLTTDTLYFIPNVFFLLFQKKEKVAHVICMVRPGARPARPWLGMHSAIYGNSPCRPTKKAPPLALCSGNCTVGGPRPFAHGEIPSKQWAKHAFR